MADGDEHAVGRQRRVSAPVLTFFSRTWVTWPDSRVPQISSTALSQTTSTFGCLNSRSCRMRLGAEMVAAMHDRHLRREIGEEQRFLDCGVAAADHDHFLAAIEEAVAGRAGRDAEALELFFREGMPSQRACAPVAMITRVGQCSRRRYRRS